MGNNTSNKSSGLSLATVLGIVFIVLKLCGLWCYRDIELAVLFYTKTKEKRHLSTPLFLGGTYAASRTCSGPIPSRW